MDVFNQIDKYIKGINKLEVNKEYNVKNFEKIDSLIIVELEDFKIVLPKRFSKLDDNVINELNSEKTKVKFGSAIIVEFEDFKAFLPNRVLRVMDDKKIEEYNKKDNLYLVVTGKEIFKDKETPKFKFIF